MSDIRTGKCLCGAVRLTLTLPSPKVQGCHCVQCQRWTGGGPLLVVGATDLRIEGAEALTHYRASDWGERGFCGICGSTIYWRLQGQTADAVAVGLLDDQSGLTVTDEIFIDHRPGWLSPWPGAAQRTEAEQIALFDQEHMGDAQ